MTIQPGLLRDVNDPAVIKRIASARITKAMAERLIRRSRAKLRLDFERAPLDQVED